MADRMIYLLAKRVKGMEDCPTTCVDDEGLNELLSAGAEVASTLPTKSVKIGAKSTKVTPMILRAKQETKGLIVANERGHQPERMDTSFDLSAFGEESPQPRGGSALAIMAGLVKSVTALANRGDEASHLGGARNHSMRGLTIISGETIGKAFDLGLSARRRGQGMSDCPFPPGDAMTRWMQGWKMGGTGDAPSSSQELARIEEDAFHLAQSLPEDAQVDVPHPAGSPRFVAWVNGFKRGGGRAGA